MKHFLFAFMILLLFAVIAGGCSTLDKIFGDDTVLELQEESAKKVSDAVISVCKNIELGDRLAFDNMVNSYLLQSGHQWGGVSCSGDP